MNEKYKKRIPKILPVGIAMGILFSSAPITEHKVKADVDTAATIITTFGEIYNTFLAEPFGEWLDETSAKSLYNRGLENSAYIAPTFQKGEFGITVFDYYKDQNFSKKVKVAYADGKVEYKTIKHGQQLRIKQAGTIVDLNPDEPEVSKHNLLYITQKQLDEGKTGVALTNWQTFYLESSNEGHYTSLADKFVRGEFPGAYTKGGVLDVRYTFRDLFNQLPEDKRKLGTATSEPISKDVLSNYVTNDSKALADFNDRVVNVFADTNSILETPLALPFITLNDGKPYQIIPYKKGSNKVFVKKGSQYLSGKEGNNLQYSDSIGDDEVFELVQIENSGQNELQFRLNNKNGVSLAGNQYISQFGTDWSFKSEIRFTAKTNNEIHNWLVDWHPSKVNETKKHEGMTYAGLEFKPDEKDSSIWTAYNSGKLITNSWIERQGDHYYADSSGILLKGWQEFEGNTYYFSPNSNHRVKNSIGYVSSDTFIDGKWYNFNEDGVLQKSAWNGLEYSDASGAFIEEGLKEIDNKIYYFKDYKATTNELRLEDQNIILHFSDKGVLEKASRLNGEALNSVNHVTLDEKTLVFEKDGSIRKNGVSKIFLPGLFDKKEQPALVYYSFEEGPNYTGWKEIDGKKYHFVGGKHYTFDGHEPIDGKRYYFNQDGEAKLTGFDKVNNKIYYYNDKGEMQTGWQEIDGKWYYFDESGAAKIGWFEVGGGYHFPYYGYFTYYAKEDGSIYTDTTVEIDGRTYKFDSHGHKGY
ncbi:cell wall-binding protein [Bacillus pseudomycoides]|uniref:Cell wall-binding protein n=1 Tax=Bacillus pseudomycoides TaxID=64104 RepID=A0AA91ZTJ2_9BACI|nr:MULTISPECIES: cell wall-binding protein [Bacillus]PEB50322.1 cell wall-binding protein [Bacillus sp. AFS098217]PED82392.1 cell wall-binding protein [Bacillus pseudomycoides]PEU05856.1 cell wall-binding protein [Bacillus sp. AFS019443]PEU17786.1 cell wall-binding protein [Bacillus sp. AFS014408]PFW63107.1 cell wall-binding protein [Bacillus sp. AFS075034]